MEKMCSHWVRPPIRNPVSSKCFTRAAATCWRTVSAKPRKRSAQAVLIPGNGGRNQLETEQIGQEFGKPVLGQKVIVQQIDHKGADPCAILDRCADPSGKGADVSV